jgi:hypothetical protein
MAEKSELIDLGYGFAKVTTNEHTGNVVLTIFVPGSADDGVYEPAQHCSIFLRSQAAIVLRDALGKEAGK